MGIDVNVHRRHAINEIHRRTFSSSLFSFEQTLLVEPNPTTFLCPNIAFSDLLDQFPNSHATNYLFLRDQHVAFTQSIALVSGLYRSIQGWLDGDRDPNFRDHVGISSPRPKNHINQIQSILPNYLRRHIEEIGLVAPRTAQGVPGGLDLVQWR
jgi:hypothetical protein